MYAVELIYLAVIKLNAALHQTSTVPLDPRTEQNPKVWLNNRGFKGSPHHRDLLYINNANQSGNQQWECLLYMKYTYLYNPRCISITVSHYMLLRTSELTLYVLHTRATLRRRTFRQIEKKKISAVHIVLTTYTTVCTAGFFIRIIYWSDSIPFSVLFSFLRLLRGVFAMEPDKSFYPPSGWRWRSGWGKEIKHITQTHTRTRG